MNFFVPLVVFCLPFAISSVEREFSRFRIRVRSLLREDSAVVAVKRRFHYAP
jgi:hypothetical protein